MALQVRRWLPGRDLVLVGDSAVSALPFLDALRRGGITAITRLHLDAALYDPAPPRRSGTIGRPRKKGCAATNLVQDPDRPGHPLAAGEHAGLVRHGRAQDRDRHGDRRLASLWSTRDPENRFEPQGLLCTDTARDPTQIVTWFVRRWQVEVTVQEARAHLGVETQRPWSDKAIARTTPCLLALFSIVTQFATRLSARERRQIAVPAWYPKSQPTFSDALAAVRRTIWREEASSMSDRRRDRRKRRFRLPPAWAYTLCQAA